MSRNRIVELATDNRSIPQESRIAPTALLSGFVVCPLGVQQLLVGQNCQWQLYEQAFRDALALAVPSVLDRFSACLLN
jgi:hypothetical protein